MKLWKDSVKSQIQQSRIFSIELHISFYKITRENVIHSDE